MPAGAWAGRGPRLSALVFGIVYPANAGWTDAVTLTSLAAGMALVGLFIANQKQSPQPLMPLRLFSSRERAGAYVARFLFNGALLSFYFFMSQYLQGVTGDTPLQAGLAFLPATVAAFAAATATSRLIRRASNALLSITGCRDADRHRLDQPRVRRHQLFHRDRAAHDHLRYWPGLWALGPHHRWDGRRRPGGRGSRRRPGQRRSPHRRR
jgi:hypothetical protein